MAEQSGQSIAAIAARLSTLADQHSALADADMALRDALAQAYTITVQSRAALDRIEDEVETMVRRQHSLSPESALGALEMHRFLLAKQREIIAVVTGARDAAKTEEAAIQRLIPSYQPAPNIGR